MSARREHLAAALVALDDPQRDRRHAVEPLRQAQADVAAADDGDAPDARRSRPTVIRRCTSAIASGVPITTALSPAARRVSPRGMKNELAAAHRDDQRRRAAGAGRRRVRRRAASRRRAGTRAAGRRRRRRPRRRWPPARATMRSMSSASCASGHTTRSMPKCAQAVGAAVRQPQEVLARDEADRARRAEAGSPSRRRRC